jgi:hypothetical protein
MSAATLQQPETDPYRQLADEALAARQRQARCCGYAN